MKAKLPANTTGYHLSLVLPAINRLLRGKGLKVVIVRKWPQNQGAHLTLESVPKGAKKAFVCDGTCAGNELGDCSHYEARRLHPTLRRRAPAKTTKRPSWRCS